MRTLIVLPLLPLVLGTSSACVYEDGEGGASQSECSTEGCHEGPAGGTSSDGTGAFGGGSGESKATEPGGCTEEAKDAQFEQVRSSSKGPDVPQECLEEAPQGTLSGSIREGYRYDGGPESISATFQSGELVSVDDMPCRALAPGKLRSDFDVENCEQLYQCGCCTFSVERSYPAGAGWVVDTWTSFCDEPHKSKSYYLGGYRF